MKLLIVFALLLLPLGVWAQDAEPSSAPEAPSSSTETPADTSADSISPTEEPPPPPHLGGLDVAVRTSLLVPVWDSFDKFVSGGGIGAEIALPVAERWRVTASLDTSSVGLAGQTFYLTSARPGIRFDAFFGPTAFMSFLVEGGWAVTTQRDWNIVDNRACAGAGTSFSFYVGEHLNFRTELRYLEVFGVLHAVTGSIGFDVIGN